MIPFNVGIIGYGKMGQLRAKTVEDTGRGQIISVYEEKSQNNNISEANNQDEVTPQLFSDEESTDTSSEGNNDEVLQNEEEDFEIPAFLRKQKF